MTATTTTDDRCIRVVYPAWLDAAGVTWAAQILRDLAPIAEGREHNVTELIDFDALVPDLDVEAEAGIFFAPVRAAAHAAIAADHAADAYADALTEGAFDYQKFEERRRLESESAQHDADSDRYMAAFHVARRDVSATVADTVSPDQDSFVWRAARMVAFRAAYAALARKDGSRALGILAARNAVEAVTTSLESA